MITAAGKDELNLMRGKEQLFKERMAKVVLLAYECIPLNEQQFSKNVSQVFESMKSIDPNQKDLSQYDEIILGKIQGRSISTNYKQVIQSIVGQISQEKFKAYLKQKTQQKNYGLTIKDKNCSIRQVKKLQTLKKYFDINEINKKRKYNTLYRTSIKSLAKYFQIYEKINQNDSESIEKAHQQYNIFMKDQKKFNSYCKELQPIQNIVERPVQTGQNLNSALVAENGVINQQMGDIQQQRKIQTFQQQNIQKKIDSQQKKIGQQNQTKTPKKTQKGKKKQSKKNDAPLQEPISGQLTQKEKVLNSQDKKDEKQKQKDKDKTIKKTVSPAPNNRNLFQFNFKKKEAPVTAFTSVSVPAVVPVFATVIVDPIKKANLIQQEVVNPVNQSQILPKLIDKQPNILEILPQQIKKTSVWEVLGQQQRDSANLKPNIQQLRAEFKSYKMENQQLPNEPYYINIVNTLSTIQYYDYFMQLDRYVNFAEPFTRIRDVFYFEDQSQQFQGQSARDQEEIQEESQLPHESDKLSDNNTIMDDDHLSFQQISSCQSYELDIKVEYGKGSKWNFNYKILNQMTQGVQLNDICTQFQMICLETDEKMPLRIDEEEQKFQFIMTIELWRDIYKVAHGYYGTKQNIIKDISALLPNVSKNWIDSMLKERSQKIGNQRYIKKQFIEDIREKIVQIDEILSKILEERNEELNKQRQQKNQQKDLKLQKDILQCTGSRYLVNLLKQLKQKGYKQIRRNQLTQFINQRKGEQWDKIKQQMNTMAKPIVEMIKNMEGPNGQKIDEEVEVDDEQYNRKFKNNQNHDYFNNSNSQKKSNQSQQQIQVNNGTKSPIKQKSTISQKQTLFHCFFNNPNIRLKKKKESNQQNQNKEIIDVDDPMFIQSQRLKNQNKKGNEKKQQNSKQMQKKRKRREKAKNSVLQNIYERPKPISKARKTRNSLRTGVMSAEEQKKMKEQQRKQTEQKQEQQNNQEESQDENEVLQNQNEIQNQNEMQNQNEIQNQKDQNENKQVQKQNQQDKMIEQGQNQKNMVQVQIKLKDQCQQQKQQIIIFKNPTTIQTIEIPQQIKNVSPSPQNLVYPKQESLQKDKILSISQKNMSAENQIQE